MIRFLTGLASGLAIASLTEPGKQIRNGLVSLVNDEVQGINLIQKAVSRAEVACNQVRAY